MIEDHVGEPRSRYAPYQSWGEQRIAGLLDKYGLPFIYEKPTAVVDNGQVRLWYPDFTLSYGLLVEYFGIQGDPGYDRRTAHKLQVYQENQMDVIPLYRRDMDRGWEHRFMGQIDARLEHRLTTYRSAVGGGYMSPPRTHLYR